MNLDQVSSYRDRSDEQVTGAPGSRTWLTVYNLGFFLVFLGLFNPLLWVSIQSGADRKIIFMNGLYTVLLAAFGITAMLIGRRRPVKKQKNAECVG